MKHDVTEWAIVTAFLAAVAAGAIAMFGDEIRTALGVDPGARRPAVTAPPRGP
jgi:hypothetical protein